jgi:hypothetical protein
MNPPTCATHATPSFGLTKNWLTNQKASSHFAEMSRKRIR